jgi:excinuclease ABC subunit A
MCSTNLLLVCTIAIRRDLVKILKDLKDLGNTIIVVEHDPDIMAEADYHSRSGSGRWREWRQNHFRRHYPELLKSTSSLTGRYLRGELSVSRRTERRKVNNKRKLSFYGRARQ